MILSFGATSLGQPSKTAPVKFVKCLLKHANLKHEIKIKPLLFPCIHIMNAAYAERKTESHTLKMYLINGSSESE